MNQDNTILGHLKIRGTITSWEAIQKYNVTRLAAIIHRLREKYVIKSVRETGNGKNWAKYILVGTIRRTK